MTRLPRRPRGTHDASWGSAGGEAAREEVLYDRDGFRRRLGAVALDEERTFEIPRGSAAEYRVIAEGRLDRI